MPEKEGAIDLILPLPTPCVLRHKYLHGYEPSLVDTAIYAAILPIACECQGLEIIGNELVENFRVLIN